LRRFVRFDKTFLYQTKTDMASELVTIEHDEPTSPHSWEVEFTLILARMINAVEEDPAQLRRAVYAFALAQLKSDVSGADVRESAQSLGALEALEAAIRGVEKFSSQSDQNERIQRSVQSEQIAPGSSSAWLSPAPMAEISQIVDPPDDIAMSGRFLLTPAAGLQRRQGSTLASITFGVLLACTTLGSLLVACTALGVSLYNQRGIRLQGLNSPSPQAASAPEKTASPPSNALPFSVPTVYGVYALDNGTLTELDALLETVPDRRVEISAPVSSPSHNVLRDRHVKFVVFRRDLVALAPERFDVRVVARVVRDKTFNSKGKARFAPVNDTWNIRNIFHEFRVRPIAGNPEMLLVQPDKADFALPSGRYVLVLRNQGYDFTIAGEVNDPAQCLERTEAANGTFYSDCEKK
jgi:hypothetical protein